MNFDFGNIDYGAYLESVALWLQEVTVQDWTWVGVGINFALTVFITIRILSNQRNTGVAIAWLAMLFLLPFLGIIAYILLGEPYLGKRYNERKVEAKRLFESMADENKMIFSKVDNTLPAHYYGVSQIGLLDTGFGVYDKNRMQLLTGTDSMFDAIIKDINQATSIILLEFYIIFPKGRVREVFAALIAAKKRGVECQILADSVGSFSFFNDEWYKKLTKAGVIVHRSLPVGLLKTLFKRNDLRNHRKIIVIDGRIGYMGSFNLVDPQFFKQNANVGQWIDVIMRIESVEPVSIVSALSLVNATDISAESRSNLDALSNRIDDWVVDDWVNDWINKKTDDASAVGDKSYRPSMSINDLDMNDKVPSYFAEKISSSNISKAYGQRVDGHTSDDDDSNSHDELTRFDVLNMPVFPELDDVMAQLIPSAPSITSQVIYDTLLTVLHRADKRIQITTPYFVPDEALLSALTTAAIRGVEVTLIIPKKVDSFLVQHASQASYAILLDAGVRIALFKGGLLHAKTVVIDNNYCLFGTVNMDMRSFYLNMELSLAIYTPAMVAQVLSCQQAYLTQCEWVDADSWRKRPTYQRLFDSFMQLFSPLL